MDNFLVTTKLFTLIPIESSDFDGKKRYVLISGKMYKPFSLAVAPPNGLIFWSDIQEPAKIERSGLDGKSFLEF